MHKQSTHSSSSDQVHLHYHYYFPEDMRSSQIGETNVPSNTSIGHRKQYQFVTPEGKYGGKMKTEGDEGVSSFNEFEKMKTSDIYANRQSSARHLHQFPSQNFMARSILEEQFHKEYESTEPIGNDSFMKKSIDTTVENEQTRQLLTFYEEQLLKCQAEISRLKMVEEECQYLRDAFYNHYTENCTNK